LPRQINRGLDELSGTELTIATPPPVDSLPEKYLEEAGLVLVVVQLLHNQSSDGIGTCLGIAKKT
jgi:hypothetical protein